MSICMQSIVTDDLKTSLTINYYADLNHLMAYADYVNPATVYLDGLFFMAQGTGNSDWERSRNSFDRVRGMISENKFIQQDLETLQQVIIGQPIQPTTYVFFVTGLAPVREQIRIDLPLFLIMPGVPYVGAAFPKLKYRDNYLSVLNVSFKQPKALKNTPLHPGKKTQEIIERRKQRASRAATVETIESTTLLSSMDSVLPVNLKMNYQLLLRRRSLHQPQKQLLPMEHVQA